MIRRQLLHDLEIVAHGDDPKGVLRGGSEDEPIELPVVGRAGFAEPRSRAAFDEWHSRLEHMGFTSTYPFQAGQREPVRAAYANAMGIA